jgi:diguanylate cyclase (GGDEF)-like protein
VHRIWRGPLGRLANGVPEVRYEVIQALLRTSLCLSAAFMMLFLSPDPELLLLPALASVAIAAGSMAVALRLALLESAEQARRWGLWSTLGDLALYASYSAAFHDVIGAGGFYGVFVLLVGPLRYGLRGILLTTPSVAATAIVWPQADSSGTSLSPAAVIVLCLALSVPAVALRAVSMRSSTRLRQAERALVHEATHDPLTNLPNRGHALNLLRQSLAAGHGMGVLFLDLDRFKVVNDGLGHAAGDQILVQVARRLREAMRSGDLVARLGGDEFVVLCREADLGVCESVAHRVLRELGRPVTTTQGLDLSVGASIGIAMAVPGDAGDLVLADADTAMYAAKAAGGGRIRVFTADLRDAVVRSHELEVDLRRALGSGQLSLAYQPMIDVTRSVVVGCEALCRWSSPRWGEVGPDEFIAVAEQSDLIVDLGDWVLQRALADAVEWPAARGGRLPSVSVNVSLRQLVAPGFAQRVTSLLEDSGLDPSRLCLEVTETMLAGEVEQVIEVLQTLRAVGVRLSIDDFGTGHASLTYLARFPVDQVKIDQSFVAGLGINAGSAAIVGGVVAMAHTFDLKVVAEGVENQEQLQTLRGLGCDVVQGYLLSHPVRQQDLLVFLNRHDSAALIPELIPPPRAGGRPQEAKQRPVAPHFSLLVDGAKDVTGRLGLDAVLRHTFLALGRAVDFDGGAILLVEDQQVRIASAVPAPTVEALEARIPLGQGVSGSIALTGEPRYLPDITIASTVTARRRAASASTGVRSWYGVPLISQGRPIGVLQIDSTTVDAFSESDRLAVLAFAPVVTLAIVSAWQAEEQLEQMQRSAG